ncbi:oligosaccharide flippase family protein [Flammeovirga sp. MY04]|uniref:lipopolysaccharide biosynthesis protein n=1 Tax=Flammeovirga sp. MY04 TaxID=1191459 RepID=UPI000825CD32|nr:oligosaccharide flippase family protein [Flammeovirga sp. MY04]ANQ47878.2 oligosaccharide flippase family protein [Flammeovirga sp. MY04]
MDSSKNNKRIASNTIMLYLRMILTMFVSLYTSRVVINVLGIEDYGIYNVVGGVVITFGFLSGAMNSATQRFLTYDIGENNHVQLRKTFNAAQIIHICIAISVVIFAETIGLWFVTFKLNLPEVRLEAALWVYHCSVLSFAITIIQAPYSALIIAHEKMSVFAYLSITDVLLKLCTVFFLSYITFDKLELYALLIFGVSVAIAAIYRIYSRIYFEETKFLIVNDKALYKKLSSYSLWNLFGAISLVAKTQGVSIILNIFFGVIVNSALGVANQVSGTITSFVSNFQMASNPQIIKSYATNHKEYMSNLVIRTSKFSFILLFILMLPVFMETEYILQLWLKKVPEHSVIFIKLILIEALIQSISGSLMAAVSATGKIKLYQFVIGGFSLLILPITYLLFTIGLPAEFTFIVSVSCASLALIFRLIFIKKLIPEFKVGQFIHEVLVRNVAVIIMSLMIPMTLSLIMRPSLIRLSLVVITTCSSCITTFYYIGMNNNEKLFMRNTLMKVGGKFLQIYKNKYNSPK